MILIFNNILLLLLYIIALLSFFFTIITIIITFIIFTLLLYKNIKYFFGLKNKTLKIKKNILIFCYYLKQDTAIKIWFWFFYFHFCILISNLSNQVTDNS
jgi:hypothetical protein